MQPFEELGTGKKENTPTQKNYLNGKQQRRNPGTTKLEVPVAPAQGSTTKAVAKCVYIYTYICIYTCVCVYIYIHVYVYIYIHVKMCVYVFIHVYVYIYTYTCINAGIRVYVSM